MLFLKIWRREKNYIPENPHYTLENANHESQQYCKLCVEVLWRWNNPSQYIGDQHRHNCHRANSKLSRGTEYSIHKYRNKPRICTYNFKLETWASHEEHTLSSLGLWLWVFWDTHIARTWDEDQQAWHRTSPAQSVHTSPIKDQIK